MKIAIEVEIFDDPEYCHNTEQDERCKNILPGGINKMVYKIHGVVKDFVTRQNDAIIEEIARELMISSEVIFFDPEIIKRCSIIIQNPGLDEIKTFCFDGKQLLRFHPCKTREVLNETGVSVFFEQYVERLMGTDDRTIIPL